MGIEKATTARAAALRQLFQRVFGAAPTAIVRAPGRVNLIGEHTDYNEGFVLPLAIDREVLVAARRRDDDTVVAYSAAYDRQTRFALAALAPGAAEPWSNYLRGVAAGLGDRGLRLPGLELAIASTIPVGAGLSSSAALELATAWAFQVLGDFRLPPRELALLCQRAEHDFAGVHCGIMDQFVVAHGRRGHALFLDCRDLSHRQVPLPPRTRIVVTDSMLRRELAGSAYNERRAQCAEGVRLLRERLPGIAALRDVSPEALAQHEGVLPELVRRRCRHVVSENERVKQAVAALEEGDALREGRLMDEAHRSLRDDFEVSLPELDVLVEAARQAGAFGARLTGAGFGGCIVSLVPEEAAARFGQQVGKAYARQTGGRAESYVCEASDGAGVVG